jgi:octaprenyl-diphosphate synthase
VDLFGSEAAAGKSLGTDLAKGKLTLPALLLWERADEADRRRLQELVQCWQNDSMKGITKLLGEYETLSRSLETIHQYLEIARQRLRSLPASDGRAGLFGLTEYLAHETDALGICA